MPHVAWAILDGNEGAADVVLSFDSDGLVVDCPDLARRIAG